MKNEKINVFDKIKEIKEENYNNKVDISALCDYDGANYLCDILHEINDNYIDIYYTDLYEWAKNNFEYINQAKQEFGSCEDINKEIQQGQYIANQEEIYNNLNDMLKLYIYNALKQNNIEEITEEQNEKIEEIAEEMEQRDFLYNNVDIVEMVANYE